MRGHVFIGATAGGLTRACETAAGRFEMETVFYGPRIRCLAVDPLDRQYAYAGAGDVGALRSDDCGKTWKPAGLNGYTVTAIAASPTNAGVVYAGTRPARLFVSTDRGATWEESAAFRRIRSRRFWFSPAEKPFVARVQGIALSPADSNRILIGIEFGAVVLSKDAGQTWTDHRRGALRDCHSLAFHPRNGNWVYEAGGTGGGAACSQDGGQTWSKAASGLDRHYGWAVAADPVDPSIWYVSVSPGPQQAHGGKNAEARIFRRDGARWQGAEGNLRQPLTHMPYALIADREIAGSLYAGMSNGEVWGTRDYGETWWQVMHRGAILPPLIIL